MDDLAALARDACRRFSQSFEPLRPDLYRYCRHLTRSPWDAEDLVQETLARALVTLGTMIKPEIETPRAWLFRVATNLYIDRSRRTREELGERPETQVMTTDARATREAAGTLIAKLSPQERAAVVLKDAFDLEHGDIAAVLGTSVGAVKAALHRGRSKLADSEESEARVPPPAALDAFCRAFNAADLPALTALLLETVTVEMPGCAVDLSLAATTDPRSGILYHTLLSPLSAGIPLQYLDGYDGARGRAESVFHRGQHVILLWYRHLEGERVRCVIRSEVDEASIARLRIYYFSPDLLTETCGELGVPVRTNGYGLD
ncbi:MAG: ECF-family polymerase sigma factor [Polyangiaceae bacterium]|jgi:RNA polymerase sigma-70 factor (ECF subfamily)|nr:ECF-family polymerase sigma factor [Polyangiaceae bacterium]